MMHPGIKTAGGIWRPKTMMVNTGGITMRTLYSGPLTPMLFNAWIPWELEPDMTLVNTGIKSG